MRYLQPLSLVVLLFVAPTFLRADDKSQPSIQVALVSSDKSDSVRNIMALAEVRLSTAPGIVVLDRQAIDKVIAEQKLSLAGIVSADQALKVGKLLAVDLFVIVETGPEGKGAAGLVVFDVRTGVRLVDTALPPAVAASVDAVVASVQAAQRKGQHTSKLRPICVMAVRNAGLPRDLDLFCDSVGLLLERQLGSSPDLAVLERRRLEEVNKERNLPVNSPLGTLLTSVVVIDLDISSGGDAKGLRATALLSDSQGRSLGKVIATVPNRNADDLALALAQQLAKNLDKKLGPERDPAARAREAQRLLKEERFLMDQRDFVHAIRAAESAYALYPAENQIRAILAKDLFHYAIHLVHYGSSLAVRGQPEAGNVDPQTLDLSLALMRRSGAYWIELENLGSDVPTGIIHLRRQFISSSTAKYWRFFLERKDMIVSDQQRAIIREITAQQQEAYGIRIRRVKNEVVDTKSFNIYTEELSWFLSSICTNRFVKEEEWIEHMQLLAEWAQHAGKFTDTESIPSEAAGKFLLEMLESCDVANQSRGKRLGPAALDASTACGIRSRKIAMPAWLCTAAWAALLMRSFAAGCPSRKRGPACMLW